MICEAVIEPSQDGTKQAIFDALSKRCPRIKWNLKTVDGALKDMEGLDKWKTNYEFDTKVYKKADKIYRMACWNGGLDLDTFTEVIFHGNNTDDTWWFFVTGNTCEVYVYHRKYMGVKSHYNHIGTLKLK